MTGRRTTPDGPIHLGLVLPEPEPVSGCTTCQQLGRQRATARAAGDDALVSDCNVWIRRHPTHEHKVCW